MATTEHVHGHTFHIDMQPIGRRGDCPSNQSLLEAARNLGVDIVAICGGEGSCGQCRVQVIVGEVSPLTTTERQALSEREIADGYRLACQTYARGDLVVHVPEGSLSAPQRTQVEGLHVPVEPDPAVRAFEVTLAAPSLTDLNADIERVQAGLLAQHDVRCDTVDIEEARRLSPRLREWNWRAQAMVRDSELVSVGPSQARCLGVAFDLGTTKIAGYLVDLATGETLAGKGAMNPQIAYGEDVITRLSRSRSEPTEARRMRDRAVEGLNGLIVALCEETGASPRDVVEVVVVANTAIHHLLLGLPTAQLVVAPYLAAVRGALDVKARDVGLDIAPGGYVHVLPNIAGFVGADHVAMILATRVWESTGTVLALDIGTNTEICLASAGRMTSVSAASGPAFEGAHIKHGMRAAPGAIEHVRIVGDRVEYQTIGGIEPVGICGSGIVDVIAQFLMAGVLNRSGTMIEHPLVRTGEIGREVVLGGDGPSAVTITQRDVREMQLAKGAIRTGITALLNDAGRTESDIDEVIIAGAFGSYIDPASAITIGMLPRVPLDRVRQVGNAAGTGARLALISREQRKRAQEIAQRVQYLELASAPEFGRIFSKSMYLE